MMSIDIQQQVPTLILQQQLIQAVGIITSLVTISAVLHCCNFMYNTVNLHIYK